MLKLVMAGLCWSVGFCFFCDVWDDLKRDASRLDLALTSSELVVGLTGMMPMIWLVLGIVSPHAQRLYEALQERYEEWKFNRQWEREHR